MNTIRKGDALELSIFEYFSNHVAEDRLPWKSECCRVFHKKGYYSRDREKNIIFDVSVEFWMPGALDYSFVWLIECKNYSNSVPVDDVEEFFTKVEQVAPANGKAIMASNSSFESGGVTFARNKRMGLMRFIEPQRVKWELMRSSSVTVHSSGDISSNYVMDGLCSNDFVSRGFDLYMQSSAGVTISLWEFSRAMLSDLPLSEAEIGSVRNSEGKTFGLVPYVETSRIEEMCKVLLNDIDYRTGIVPLERIYKREWEINGLDVTFDGSDSNDEGALGKISFNPPRIVIYKQAVANLGRERFTLAHELAHHFLSHGQYMTGELCEERDFLLVTDGKLYAPDVARMEIQANIFASFLLMPTISFVNDFRRAAIRYSICNKGFGELYLDEQPCNFRNFQLVTSELMERYSVSRAAAKIRLEGLGLLRDVRSIGCLGSK